MQYGDEQCRNVESTITTPVAVAATSTFTPGPPAPPSSCSPRNVIALELATLSDAAAPAGVTARPLTTIRCEPLIVMPATLAPASPVSVRSARPVMVTGA
jgi:hypothetical protein